MRGRRAGLAGALALLLAACTGTTATTRTTGPAATSAPVATTEPADPCGHVVVRTNFHVIRIADIGWGSNPAAHPLRPHLLADGGADPGAALADLAGRAAQFREARDELTSLQDQRPAAAAELAADVAQVYAHLAGLYDEVAAELAVEAEAMAPGADWRAWDDVDRRIDLDTRRWDTVWHGEPVVTFVPYVDHLSEHCPTLRDNLARGWRIIGDDGTTWWGRWDTSTLNTVVTFSD